MEKLGTTDKGVILFRNMLKRELQRVAAGHDPIGTVRDPAKREITFHLERDKLHFTDGFERLVRNSPISCTTIADELCEIFKAYNSEKMRELFPPEPREPVPAG